MRQHESVLLESMYCTLEEVAGARSIEGHRFGRWASELHSSCSHPTLGTKRSAQRLAGALVATYCVTKQDPFLSSGFELPSVEKHVSVWAYEGLGHVQTAFVPLRYAHDNHDAGIPGSHTDALHVMGPDIDGVAVILEVVIHSLLGCFGMDEVGVSGNPELWKRYKLRTVRARFGYEFACLDSCSFDIEPGQGTAVSITRYTELPKMR